MADINIDLQDDSDEQPKNDGNSVLSKVKPTQKPDETPGMNEDGPIVEPEAKASPAEVHPVDPRVNSTVPKLPQAASISTHSEGTSNKKMKILGLLLLLVALVVGGWFLLKANKKAAPAQSGSTQSTQQQTAKKQKLLVYQDPVLYAVDGGEKTTLATVEPNSIPLSYQTKNGAISFFYAKPSDGSAAARYKEILKSDGKTATSIFTVPKDASYLVLSSDGAYLAYHQDVDSPTYSAVLHIVKTDDGKDTTYEQTTGNARLPIGFTDKGQLVMQHVTCYRCDGPPKASVDIVDPTTGKTTKTYETTLAGDTKASNGNVELSWDGSQAYLIADSTISAIEATAQDIAKGDSMVQQVDLASGAVSTIYKKEKTDEAFPNFVGNNVSTKKAYISLSKASDTGAALFSKLLEADGSGKSEISLEFATLKNSGVLEQAYSIDGSLLYTVLSTKGIAIPGNKMALVSLPYKDANATTTNIFDSSDKLVKIMGIVSE